MPEEPRACGEAGRYALPTDSLFRIPSVREVEQQVSQEATQLWRDVRQQYSPRNVANEVLQNHGILPPTRLTSEDNPTNITVEGNLRTRTGRVEALSPSGFLTLDVKPVTEPVDPFKAPSLRDFSYNLNAQSANERYRLHIWANQANQAPNIDLSARVSDYLSLSYIRDQQQNIASMQASFLKTDISAAHNFRLSETTFSANRRVEDGLRFGVNFSTSPRSGYNFGADIRYDFGYKPPVYRPLPFLDGAYYPPTR